MGAGNQAKQRFPKALLLFLWIQGPGVHGPSATPVLSLSPISILQREQEESRGMITEVLLLTSASHPPWCLFPISCPPLSLSLFFTAVCIRWNVHSMYTQESACNAGDLGSVRGSGRSPIEGNGNPLQYSCLENYVDRGAWWATFHGVAKSWTRLSD